jgi:hypothetical protein
MPVKPKSKLRKCKAWGCKVEFIPSGPRQIYHDVKCRDNEAHRRQRAIAKQQQK